MYKKPQYTACLLSKDQACHFTGSVQLNHSFNYSSNYNSTEKVNFDQFLYIFCVCVCGINHIHT